MWGPAINIPYIAMQTFDSYDFIETQNLLDILYDPWNGTINVGIQ